MERYATTVRRYLAQTCGAGAATRLAGRALDAIARGGEPGMSGSHAADVVKRAARAVAFGELARRARRPDERIRRLWTRHWHCATTPVLLHARARGETSEADLDRLYRHLDHCNHCAAIAGRCDLAEWHLGADLAAPGEASSNGAQPPAGRDPLQIHPQRDPGPGPVPAAGALALWRESSGPVALPHARRVPRRPVLAALVLAVVLAGGAAVVRGRGGPTRHRPATPRPAPAPAPAPAAAAPATYGLRTPFVVDGARVAVFRNPQQGWTTFLRTDPGRGKQWLAVTVRVRNVTLPAFDPRVLDYRIFDRSGMAYAPVPTIGSGPARTRPARPLAPGELVETRLGFRVDRRATGLLLRFSPVPGGTPIVVSLGP